MKRSTLSILLLALTGAMIGCGAEKAPGYDAASRDAAEALARNNNDITKLTPEQRAALEQAALKTRPTGGGLSRTPGTASTSGQ